MEFNIIELLGYLATFFVAASFLFKSFLCQRQDLHLLCQIRCIQNLSISDIFLIKPDTHFLSICHMEKIILQSNIRISKSNSCKRTEAAAF